MSDARTNIMNRLREAASRARTRPDAPGFTEADWLARQPPMGDLVGRFQAEAEKLQSKVIRVKTWDDLPTAVTPWFREFRVESVMTGEEPRLEPLRQHLEKELGLKLLRYDRTLDEQRDEIFDVDCGVTTSFGAVAETGTVVLVPSVAEPRLLSLAPPVHLVVVETGSLFPTITELVASGAYQQQLPSNLVFISGASRTADIELTLVMGAHGPKVFLVALVG